MAAFEEFGILPEIAKAIDTMEWSLPTDVQAEAIPLILGGGDVLMAAETGSGKTGAFCLPILQIVWETIKDIEDGKMSNISVKGSSKNKVVPWTMSVYDRGSNLAIASDGLRCQSRDFKVWYGCRCTTGVVSPGRYYYEATIIDEGLCRVGWSTQQANLDLGTCPFGYGFGGTGKKSNERHFDNYGEAFGQNDVIGCFLDLNNMEIGFSKNGVHLGRAFTLPYKLRNEVFYPAVVLKNAEILFNFGNLPFKYPPMNGFLALYLVNESIVKTNPHNFPTNTKLINMPLCANTLQAIVIEPSRELAEQTFTQLEKFKIYLNNPQIHIRLVIGGMRLNHQRNMFNEGVNIIVGTPGRIEEMLSEGLLNLSHCRFFVLDEADALLKSGYTELIDRLHKQIPKMTTDGRRLQMIVCSATLHDFEVKKMADRLMYFPTWIDLKGEDSVPETVHHVVCMINPQIDVTWKNLSLSIATDGVHEGDNLHINNANPETFSEAVKLLKAEYCMAAIDKHKMDRAIIFCRTKLDCDNLENFLRVRGGKNYSCTCLHSDRKPDERKRNLEKFKNYEVKFLICTDVAARGIDITGLPYMINITLPDDKANYLHRIGRVGRADRMGLAISLVSTVPEKVWYHGAWCSTRGRNCRNTNLTSNYGCCIWYNELNLLAEIEDHLKITIPQVGKDMNIAVNEFDGKVVYGEKNRNTGTGYDDHVVELQPIVQKLSTLELNAQSLYLKHLGKTRTLYK